MESFASRVVAAIMLLRFDSNTAYAWSPRVNCVSICGCKMKLLYILQMPTPSMAADSQRHAAPSTHRAIRKLPVTHSGPPNARPTHICVFSVYNMTWLERNEQKSNSSNASAAAEQRSSAATAHSYIRYARHGYYNNCEIINIQS